MFMLKRVLLLAVNRWLTTIELSALVLLLLAGCARQPASTATFQCTLPQQSQTEDILRRLLPEDGSATLKPLRNTELFSLTVADDDPQEAAKRANEIVASLQKAITATNREAKFEVWEPAKPAVKP